MKTSFLKALRLTLVLLLLFSGVYTFLVYGIAQVVPGKGKGEMISAKGKSYYANIGQAFTEDKYFHGRPSAVHYNASGSGGSNKGPYNEEYLDVVKNRVDTFLKHNPDIKKSQIPVELVTASGSGLDPDISPKGALVQVKRIAMIRKISDEQLISLVKQQTERPVMGPERINVLKLNIALDKIRY